MRSWEREKRFTVLQFGFLHLVADFLLQLALVGVGEFGDLVLG